MDINFVKRIVVVYMIMLISESITALPAPGSTLAGSEGPVTTGRPVGPIQSLTLNWCVQSTGHYPNFRHFINCDTKGSFMEKIGLRLGDEMIAFHMSFVYTLSPEHLLRTLNAIRTNETFELIYRRGVPPNDCRPGRGNCGMVERERYRLKTNINENVYTYVRARVLSTANRTPGTSSSGVVEDRVETFKQINTIDDEMFLPAVSVVIGTNSLDYICNSDPLYSCSSLQMFERIAIYNFRSQKVYIRFRLPATHHYIKATGSTNVAIGSTDLDSDSSTYFIANPVSLNLRLYTLTSCIYPTHHMFENANKSIEMRPVGQGESFESYFDLWVYPPS